MIGRMIMDEAEQRSYPPRDISAVNRGFYSRGRSDIESASRDDRHEAYWAARRPSLMTTTGICQSAPL